MNTQEKLIAILLGLCLVGWLFYSYKDQQRQAEIRAAQMAAQAAAEVDAAAAQPAAPATAPTEVKPAAEPTPPAAAKPAKQHAPEQVVVLSNAQIAVSLSTRGAVVKAATLFDFAEKPGPISDENPPVSLDFSASPVMALTGAGVEADDDYEIVERGDDFVAFRRGGVVRKVTLKPDYQISLEEDFGAVAADDRAKPGTLSLGAMPLGASKNDILSIDSWNFRDEKGREAVEHHGETDPLKGHLAGSIGGCSGKPDASGMPEMQTISIAGARKWIAVKNRFFVSALASCSDENSGFVATVRRDMERREYQPKSVAADASFKSLPEKRVSLFYLGPKKQSILWGLGMKDVMEFGMWRWVCYPIVWCLNLFNSWIPSFGIGIILLTVLVRVLFWPLTHKSTVSMRRMSEIQPKIKEIREKFKDNPQRLQQETWAVYRDNKVNPAAGCLPMLVQIPVFIALFTVLRSAVELRYAPFLWIADLSEPEALGATSWFPYFGGLNILPILMAATMALQSAVTPSGGDKNQQRMMMVMMPLMMLVMFYSFPSALSLYWTVSQVLSIAQMWWIRKRYTPVATPASEAVVDMPVTRQMRRHGGA